MLERWCEKAWAGTKRAAADPPAPLQALRKIAPGVWVALLLALVIAGREAQRFQRRHTAHREEVAEAIGSVGFFYGPPQPDHSGGSVYYLRTSGKGLGLYRYDLGGGSATLLQEWEAPPGRSLRGQSLLPLSPDDRFLPMTVSIGASRGALAVCEAESGKELVRVDAAGMNVTEAAWLSATKLAWLAFRAPLPRQAALFRLHLTERGADGNWTDRSVSRVLTNASCLAALSEDTVAWADLGSLCKLEVASDIVSTLFSPDDATIAEASYSASGKRFLVTCKEKNGRSVWRVDITNAVVTDVAELGVDRSVESAQWTGNGKSWAYLSRHTPVIRAEAGGGRRRLEAAADTLVAAHKGDSLFFVGSVGEEPGLGLWRYSVGSQMLTNLVCYSDRPSSFARRIEPVHATLKTGSGPALPYYLYRPAHFSAWKKYPLLLGDTLFGQMAYQRDFDGPSWAEAMANCGAYVVIVERKRWFPKDDQEWGRGVMALYEKLKDEPSVDCRRIFLFGVSAETGYTSRLLEQRPEPWNGVVFMNPGVLPEVQAFKPGRHLPRILVSAGKEEGELDRLKRFQEEACAHGILVEFVEHPNASHVLTSIPATRERIRAMKDFIFQE